MRSRCVLGGLLLGAALSVASLCGQDLAAIAPAYIPRLETNLYSNIFSFWYPATLDQTNGGYLLNHDINGRLRGPGTKMIVTQARMVWLYSRLAREGYQRSNCLAAAECGFRFLRDKMWDKRYGGFYWQVDVTGDRKLRVKKHLYGQSFALYALSEYYLASGKPEALALATRLFHLMEEKAHDPTCGGYREWFNEDWTPSPPGEPSYVDSVGSDFKLMNTHLHLLESMTCFYLASRLPLARERLLELIAIQSNAVVRKGLGACTDKYRRNWEPVLTDGYARVSYGHDLENIWLLTAACNAAGVSNYPLLDLYRSLFAYALKYGYDREQGGFFYYGPFNQPAADREKIWWVQAEACVSSLYLYRMTGDAQYLAVFQKTFDWVDHHQTDWQHGEWYEAVEPDGAPQGIKADNWKAGYHDGRAMIECLDILKSAR
jgi:mannobiose 2-epimerase